MASVILNRVPALQSVLAIYRSSALKGIIFEVPCLPPSLNHHHVPILRTSRTGKRYIGQRLSEDAKAFRSLVAGTLRAVRFDGHAVAAVIAFESSRWICKNGKARRADMDNRIKELLDAIQLATGIRDELIWHVHAFKVASGVERTTVHLFSLGGTMLG